MSGQPSLNPLQAQEFVKAEQRKAAAMASMARTKAVEAQNTSQRLSAIETALAGITELLKATVASNNDLAKAQHRIANANHEIAEEMNIARRNA